MPSNHLGGGRRSGKQFIYRISRSTAGNPCSLPAPSGNKFPHHWLAAPMPAFPALGRSPAAPGPGAPPCRSRMSRLPIRKPTMAGDHGSGSLLTMTEIQLARVWRGSRRRMGDLAAFVVVPDGPSGAERRCGWSRLISHNGRYHSGGRLPNGCAAATGSKRSSMPKQFADCRLPSRLVWNPVYCRIAS